MYYREREMDEQALNEWTRRNLEYLTRLYEPPWNDAKPEDSSEETTMFTVTAEEARQHAASGITRCRWPVHCAMCGAGLNRWYLCARAPMCVWCHGASGPVLHPAMWEMAPERISPAARRVWESWATVAGYPVAGRPEAFSGKDA